MTAWREIVRFVESRAERRCEYCRMHQSLQGATFHVEHVVPESRGGVSHLDNLAWACPRCNLSKSDRIEAKDPDSGAFVQLFDPRAQIWSAHFRWNGYHVGGQTDVGRATLTMLELNHPRRLRVRQAEALFGLFPCD